MAADDIWIVGSNMTKFGKHPDKDAIDLAAEASMAALADAGITMAEVGVLGVGNLMNAGAGVGQQLQKQIGQTGIPVFNVANACATGATALRVAIMAVKAGETDVGMAVGVEKLAGAGLLGQGNRFIPRDRPLGNGRTDAVQRERHQAISAGGSCTRFTRLTIRSGKPGQALQRLNRPEVSNGRCNTVARVRHTR